MSNLGALLRQWRNFRSISQLELSLVAGITQRHLSFVESGKSQPSRELVLRLGQELGMGLRDQNAFLVSAGYAPKFAEADWGSSELAEIRKAARLLLESHEPNPGFVLDASSAILDANDAALALLGATRGNLGHLNLVDLVFREGPIRDAIVNFEEVARFLLDRLRETTLYRGPSSEARRVYERALDLAKTLGIGPAIEARAMTLLPLEFRVGDEIRRYYTTVTTFGAPQDALVSEIAIELFHPLP